MLTRIFLTWVFCFGESFWFWDWLRSFLLRVPLCDLGNTAEAHRLKVLHFSSRCQSFGMRQNPIEENQKTPFKNLFPRQKCFLRLLVDSKHKRELNPGFFLVQMNLRLN